MSKKALNVQDDSRCKGIQGNTSKSEIKCVCLNARSIINKKTELNIMVDDIKPHIIGITESWANKDITNAKLGLEGYVMFRKDRIGQGRSKRSGWSGHGRTNNGAGKFYFIFLIFLYFLLYFFGRNNNRAGIFFDISFETETTQSPKCAL